MMNEEPPLVLIIDDDPDIAEVAKLVVEEEGYRVIVDHTGNYFKHNRVLPDLVLLDLLIEGNNGEKIAQQLKLSPDTKHIPVIVVSAHTPTEVRAVVEKTRADEYITKPFDIDHLTQVVNMYLRAR